MKVDYICHSGDDLLVVNAARVSLEKHHEEFKDNDEGLINFLTKHNHISPFFHPHITLRVSVPIFVANQLKRHQVGFAVNEVSRRYVDSEPEFYVTDKLGKRAPNKKQGALEDEFISAFNYDEHGSSEEVCDVLSSIYEDAIFNYNWLLERGVAPEDARMVLPLATYTSFYWTGSLYAYARMYNLRSKEDTQRQTRDVSEMIGKIIEPLFPYSWRALCQNVS